MRKEPPTTVAAPKEKVVQTTVIDLTDISSEIQGLGKLSSAQPLVLYSEVSGTLIKGEIPFQPAQFFQRGQLLLKIDDRQINLEINSAKSDFLNALSSVLPEIKVDFPQEFQTWQAYFNQCGVYSDLPDLPEAQNQKIKLFLSRFNVYKLYFAVRNLEVRLEKHYFYAPFSGSILTADLRVGAIARNGTRLGEVINLEDMEVEIPVPPADIEWIERSKPVSLRSDELSREWQGKISRISNAIDPRTQSIPVFVRPDYEALRSIYEGIFIKVKIPGKTVARAAKIPRKAMYQEKYVYCIKNGRLDYRPVQVVRRETDSVIINAGLADGDTLVVEVMQGVAAGMRAVSKNEAGLTKE